MDVELRSKIVISALVVAGAVSWTVGFIMNQWMTAVCGLVLLTSAMGAYTNLRIYRIEKKLGMRK